ncbi:unnamed protein product [Leuciscus chuanchicus]
MHEFPVSDTHAAALTPLSVCRCASEDALLATSPTRTLSCYGSRGRHPLVAAVENSTSSCVLHPHDDDDDPKPILQSTGDARHVPKGCEEWLSVKVDESLESAHGDAPLQKSKWGKKTRCATAGRSSYVDGEGRFVYLTPLSSSSNPPPSLALLSRTAAHVTRSPCAPNSSGTRRDTSISIREQSCGSLNARTKLNEPSQLLDGKREHSRRLLTSLRISVVDLVSVSENRARELFLPASGLLLVSAVRHQSRCDYADTLPDMISEPRFISVSQISASFGTLGRTLSKRGVDVQTVQRVGEQRVLKPLSELEIMRLLTCRDSNLTERIPLLPDGELLGWSVSDSCSEVKSGALGSVRTCWQHQDPPGEAGRDCVMLLYESRGDINMAATLRLHCVRSSVRSAANKSRTVRLHNPSSRFGSACVEMRLDVFVLLFGQMILRGDELLILQPRIVQAQWDV